MAPPVVGQGSLVGQELGHYRLLEKIGEGGMGVVYRARDEHLKCDVAVKVLPTGMLSDERARQRFRKEALALSGLNHPNITVVHDFDTCDQIDYLVEELIPGLSLDEMLRSGALNEKQCIELGIQLCNGLAAAHEHGIIHRDIKPSNIRITPDGHLKILDFGLAKSVTTALLPADESPTLSETQTIAGTYPYMSPEQLTNKKLDARTDIWSAGTVLYEMATGRRAFACSGAALTDAILHATPTPPSRLEHKVSQSLEAIIQKCLEKDPGLRYQSAREIAVDLKRLREPSSSLHAVPPKPRSIWVWLSSVVVLTGAIGAVLLWRACHPPQAAAITDKDTIVLADLVNNTTDPVFTDTLRQGLFVQLNQSPFLNILSDNKVRDTLKQMGHKGGEPLNDELAREVCERNQSKVYIGGSIASLGNQYVLGLRAVNCLTGDTVVQQQTHVPRKEDVLDSLGKQGTLLRRQLGESLASIQKFDVPLEQATTSSLEALQAYTLGSKQFLLMNYPAAIMLYQRAIELDPTFATAYSRLASAHGNWDRRSVEENAAKAYELREHATERERLSIESNYHAFRGEYESAIQVYELWRTAYPNDWMPERGLENIYDYLGQYEKAAEEGRRAYLKNANSLTCWNIVETQFSLNEFDHAKSALLECKAYFPENEHWPRWDYSLAFARNNEAEMKRIVDAAVSDSAVGRLLLMERSESLFYAGRVNEGREYLRRSVESCRRTGRNDLVIRFQANAARAEATLGNASEARRIGNTIRASVEEQGQIFPLSLACARAGDLSTATDFAGDLERRYPTNTLVKNRDLPLLRAAIELQRGNPSQTIHLLESAASSEFGDFDVPYTRGEAYLQLRRGNEAAAEFNKILGHPGAVGTNVIGALAHVGLARAYVLQGDTAKAKAEYEHFLNLWKDADADIPIYQQAKTEYAKLQ